MLDLLRKKFMLSNSWKLCLNHKILGEENERLDLKLKVIYEQLVRVFFVQPIGLYNFKHKELTRPMKKF